MRNTKSIIIQTGFEAIHKHGYHKLRIDKELSKLGITKGAFYHYFSDKESLLTEVITEILGPKFIKPWIDLANSEQNCLDAIQDILQSHIDQSSLSEIKYGCVFNNLVHETASSMPKIRTLLFSYFNTVVDALELALKEGVDKLEIKPQINARDLSLLILSIYNGGNSINKLHQKAAPYKKSTKAFILLLENIRNES